MPVSKNWNGYEVIMRKLLIICLVLILTGISPSALACTLFGASGNDWVDGGGVLVAKNRDWTPQPQQLKLVSPSEGYRYYGLFAGEEGYESLKGGINEQGLVVFTATAGTIPREERLMMPQYKGGTMKALLTSCNSVDEVLAANDTFMAPQFLIVADRTKVAYVEIGPEGKYAIRQQENGFLYHTNHYLEESMQWANYNKPGNSSMARFNRIGDLLSTHNHPFSMEDFISFSNDRNGGLHNSIWRVGSGQGTQTLAALIVYLPPQGSPVMYTKIRHTSDEKGKEPVLKINIDEVFRK